MEIKPVNGETKNILQTSDSNVANPLVEAQVQDNLKDDTHEQDSSTSKGLTRPSPMSLFATNSNKSLEAASKKVTEDEAKKIEILAKYANHPKGWSALNYAIEERDFEAAIILVDYVKDFGKIDNQRNALSRVFANANTNCIVNHLPFELSSNEIELIKKLIKKGINIHGEGSLLPTPLAGAALFGLEDVVADLLDKGVDVNEGYCTPLRDAVTGRNINIIKLLLSRGADVNKSNALYGAVQQGNMDLIELLLDAGAEINGDNAGTSPLAMVIGDPLMVKYLLERGADPNGKVPSTWGTSMLGMALGLSEKFPGEKELKEETIRLLLEYGATLP